MSLKANAADGETDVFVLGMSHVSRDSVKAVRSLIEAVRPEVSLLSQQFLESNLLIRPPCKSHTANKKLYSSKLMFIIIVIVLLLRASRQLETRQLSARHMS